MLKFSGVAHDHPHRLTTFALRIYLLQVDLSVSQLAIEYAHTWVAFTLSCSAKLFISL